MDLNKWLSSASKKLEGAGIGSVRLDCLILLEDELGKDRTWILAHPETELAPNQLKKLERQISRRTNHEPLAYIRGFTEFYGRQFKINKRVLEPRPESETMVELLLGLVKTHKLKAKSPAIADVGTGSGAIGITAALEIHGALVDLYDIDSSCLAVARHNALMHELHLHCYKRDLLNRPLRDYDVILANLPYVPNSWKINEAAAMEPRIAIFGGKDGLDLYRRMFAQISKMETRPQYVLTECLPPQHEALQQITETHGYKLLQSQDFIQVFTPARKPLA